MQRTSNYATADELRSRSEKREGAKGAVIIAAPSDPVEHLSAKLRVCGPGKKI